ncbi:Vacuolar protein-sorting-associated protein 25 [Wickerhamomyces ciferrii]|uniref:Vacuolar protein-sorting-associated protein 25 n=1 Tax=Wickerhamomyces ciferrii (strain ATCC 14091 / BCRC 22168 / CBS 111 / JCM 3599 / NBRC 0793 / NRRL Y-1031 F-60-10) TaxID=1206466 RepID=K0KIV6_WICCF|nr:Vacuolar protein-sorting-associated protein 25 [Wickerhamomyces ciferrii]CCH42087.1 Vacuolar protein-sorting-associated protein 25 [Wickerhamomyces ciferrii]
MSQYKFPQIYNFPPFFTKQPNEQTWQAQLNNWIQLILSYCKANKVWILNNKGEALSQGNIEDLEESITSLSINQDDGISKDGIFVNNKIQRRLEPQVINEIFQQMVKNNDAFYITKKDQSSVFINFYRPEDWASMILEWIESTGQNGTVLTMYEISQGDLSLNKEFHGIHPVILETALNVLVKRSRAQLLKDEDGKIAGVKIV